MVGRRACGVEGVREDWRGGITPDCGMKATARDRVLAGSGRKPLNQGLSRGRNVSVVMAVANG